MGVDEVMAFLRAEITEENTDQLLDWLVQLAKDSDKVPWWVKKFALGFVRGFVDKMLPDTLLDAIENLLRGKKAIT